MNYAPETKCVKIKLKKNSLDRVKDWQAFILEHKEKALETIKSENVLVEAVFLDHADDNDYLIYFMSAKNLKKSQEFAKNSQNPVDKYHNNFKKECWEDGKRLEELVVLYNL